ncbi:MAG TPA: hypothetical protein VIH42_03210 [Thermoguttaceae bacterium]
MPSVEGSENYPVPREPKWSQDEWNIWEKTEEIFQYATYLSQAKRVAIQQLAASIRDVLLETKHEKIPCDR